MKPVKAIVLAAAFAMGTASAATMNLQSMDYTRGADIYINAGGTVEFGFAGVMTGSLDGGSPFGLFCVDLFIFIDVPGTYDVNVLANTGVNNGANVGYLYTTYYNALTTPDDFAALQIAIWDVVHDNGDGIFSGSVQEDSANPWSSAFRARINQFIGEGMANVSSEGSVYENVVGPNFAQTLFGLPAPEPSSFIMIGSGIGALAMLRRRKA